jgi:myosin-18
MLVIGLNNKYQFARPTSAQFAAEVLGTSSEELSRVIFSANTSGQALSPAYRNEKDQTSSTNEMSGVEALEGFVTGLYYEAFQAIVSLINR